MLRSGLAAGTSCHRKDDTDQGLGCGPRLKKDDTDQRTKGWSGSVLSGPAKPKCAAEGWICMVQFSVCSRRMDFVWFSSQFFV